MLVSGAVLFGLLQLVPALNDFTAHIEPHYGVLGIVASAGLGLLGLTAVYALIACFVVHLALRGWWVAMVGVHSVFPRGIRWERMKENGPITRGIHERRLQPLPTSIARCDNAASLIFATGFVLAMTAANSALLILVSGGLVWAAMRAGAQRPELVLVAVLAPVALLYVLTPMVDYKFGARLTGAPERLVRRMLSAVLRLQPASLWALQAVLTTNVDKRVAYGVLFGGFAAATATALGSREADGDVPGASSYAFFDDESDTRAVHAQFYDSLRGASASPRAPSIQSDVIVGPYVRLFVPYVTLRHEAALRRVCPGLRPLDHDEDATPAGRAAADSVLRCALRLHRPALDGRPLDTLAFRFFANPRTERRGFLMLIPTAGLAPGEHRLTVWPARREGARTPNVPWTIPFWR